MPTGEAALRPRRMPRPAVAAVALLVACAAAVGILRAAALAAPAPGAARMAWTVPDAPVGAASPVPSPARVAPRTSAPARDRWRAIVIHESGTPAGDLGSIERRHCAAGLAGLGFHFVIGNGSGMDDGQVAVGYRWDRQLPGAHALAGWRARARGGELDGRGLNEHAIAICLVGNSARRPMSDRQRVELGRLVEALQAEFAIPAEAVHHAGGFMPAAAGALPGVR